MLLLAFSPQVSCPESPSPGASTPSSWSWQLPPSVRRRRRRAAYMAQRTMVCSSQEASSCRVFSAGGAPTGQVQIWNHTPRELRFDLSWPAHCLTITPQHGLIDPQSVHDESPLESGFFFFYELVCVCLKGQSADFNKPESFTGLQICPAALERTGLCPVRWSTEGKHTH